MSDVPQLIPQGVRRHYLYPNRVPVRQGSAQQLQQNTNALLSNWCLWVQFPVSHSVVGHDKPLPVFFGFTGFFYFVTKKVSPPGGTRTHDRAVMITVFGVAGCSLYTGSSGLLQHALPTELQGVGWIPRSQPHTPCPPPPLGQGVLWCMYGVLGILY